MYGVVFLLLCSLLVCVGGKQLSLLPLVHTSQTLPFEAAYVTRAPNTTGKQSYSPSKGENFCCQIIGASWRIGFGSLSDIFSGLVRRGVLGAAEGANARPREECSSSTGGLKEGALGGAVIPLQFRSGTAGHCLTKMI